MPRGKRKFKCDFCGRYFSKTKYGYYITLFKNEEIVLCEDCKKKEEEENEKFYKKLILPLEIYEKESEDIKCDICYKYYSKDKVKLIAIGDKNICGFCNKNELGED